MRGIPFVLALFGAPASGSSADPPAATPCEVEALLEARCVRCHSAAGGIRGGLDLEPDPLRALVNQPSASYAGRTLVVPGDPSASLLVAKVSGTQGAAGAAMPPQASLDEHDVAKVRAWVASGAQACGG